MKVPSKLLKAAQHCQGNGDVRYYLNGIHIFGNKVEATNGHVAVRMTMGSRVKKNVIVNIAGKVPSKAHESRFEFRKNEEIVKHFDICGQMVGCQPVDVIDGSFPNLDKVIPKKSDSKATESVGVRAEYAALALKMFGKNAVTKVTLHGDEKCILVEPVGICAHGFGEPLLIIMPARL